jgi:hypothetical protein
MFGDGFEQSTILPTGLDWADAGHHAELVGRARVGFSSKPMRLSCSCSSGGWGSIVER